ncbi:hypothetical protein ACFFJT_06310 [Dyella flava]|uniref:DUF2946 family protein n=1 Tax=Dyella flava TaxID=1920170 RepID=A0ABS2K2G6_9GAMM|nr:hypothetical protein [Dyella flava]MBM7124855.1 hypothetical protein [Dyella flava]
MRHLSIPKLGPARWRLRDIRRARLTRWLLLGGLLFMLGLQSALATYVCTMPDDALGPTMAMGASAADRAMASTCPQMKHTAADRALCAKHCASDASAPTAIHPLSVPPSALVALPPLLPTAVALLSPMTFGQRQRDRLRAPPPPASLLFCSLLI